jgi:hypothetical protein
VRRGNNDGGAIINLKAGTYFLSIAPTGSDDNGTSGDLELASPMTITGAGAQLTTISPSGAWNDRIIETSAPTDPPSYTFSDLTIQSGNDVAAFDESDGGGILNDGGGVTLHNVVLKNNDTTRDGGGVESTNGGTLTISNSTFTGNTASENGGGLDLKRPTSGANVFSNLYFTGNTANGPSTIDSGGGAIYDELGGTTGSAAFTDLMIVGNHAPGMSGGGIYDDSRFTTGANSAVTYTNLTVANNDAKNFGGGVYIATLGFAKMTNATITGNSLTGTGSRTNRGSGAGVAVGRAAAISLNNATINGNSSPAIGQAAGLALLDANDQATVHNTILTNNKVGGSVKECFKSSGPQPPVITSQGYNLADDTTCGFTQTGDQQAAGLNPNLGPLQDNGGPTDGAPGATSPTLTEALPLGSIAIDKADPDNSKNPATDERHVNRPVGAASDVGAFEFVPTPPSSPPALPKSGGPIAQDAPDGSALLLMAVVGLLALSLGSLAGRRRRAKGLS